MDATNPVSVRICTKCKETLTDEHFHKSNLAKKSAQCRKCINLRTAARYTLLRESGLCFDCYEPVTKSSICTKCKERRRILSITKYKDRNLKYGKNKRIRLKKAAMAAYGGECCSCCGETTIEFLSIDHINNDGAAHRRNIKNGYGNKMYEWLHHNKYPPGFQVLCMNCNFAKGHFGVCPHKREKNDKDLSH